MESSLAIVFVVTHFAFNLAYSVLLEIRAFHKEGAAQEICLSAVDSGQWCSITSITYYIAQLVKMQLQMPIEMHFGESHTVAMQAGANLFSCWLVSPAAHEDGRGYRW